MPSPCKSSNRQVGRHDLVFISPRGWRSMLAKRGDLAVDPLVARWPDEGWPAIGRRAMPGEAPGVALGLPLPPSAGKKRLSFLVQPDDILSVALPPSLADVRGSAPPAWQPTLERLADLALHHSVEVRVFGSLAWRMLTGLDYVTSRSDLDLLLNVRPETNFDRLTADLAAAESEAPMRLDGELVREDGAAVNWRELHAGVGEVLVKHIDGIALLGRHQFISGGAIS